jgi:hypothetical protein
MPRLVFRLLWAGTLLSLAAVTGHAGDPPQRVAVRVRAPKPRLRPTVGDRWRVRVSHYPMQIPEPQWEPPETWVFAVIGLEATREGPRLIITAQREGTAKPALRLELDEESRALKRVESILPAQDGERRMVERPIPGKPFVSMLSPVPLAFASPDTFGPKLPDAAVSSPERERVAAVGSEPAPFAFTFDSGWTQTSEPVDAGVGRALIERGMGALKQRRTGRLEPDGVPRYVTRFQGQGVRIEQVWDETTPWPLYTATDASQVWLVSFAKGK